MSDGTQPPATTPPGGPTRMPPVGPERFGWFRRFAKLWGFLAFFFIVAFWFRAVLLPFILALGVAYVLAPVVQRLSSLRIGRRHVPRGLAVIICYLIVLGLLTLFVVAFLPRLSADFARLGQEAPRMWDRVNREWTPQAARWLEQKFPSLAPAVPVEPEHPVGPVEALPSPPGTILTITPMADGDYAVTVPERGIVVERVDDKRIRVLPPENDKPRKLEDILRERILRMLSGLESRVDDLVKLGQALVAGTIAFIMNLVLVLMVAGFILIDIGRIHSFVRGLVPRHYRGDYDVIASGMDRGLNGVIRGQLIICLINGVLTWIGLFIFDVKYSLLLAVIAAVLSLIPIFGSILSSIPIVAIAMVSGAEGVDILRGLFMLIWILGIHFVEGNFLNPKIIGSSAKMHPVLVIFALIAGEHSYGLVGALLAVPVASMIQTLFVFFRSRAWQHASASTAPFSSGPVEPSIPPPGHPPGEPPAK